MDVAQDGHPGVHCQLLVDHLMMMVMIMMVMMMVVMMMVMAMCWAILLNKQRAAHLQ